MNPIIQIRHCARLMRAAYILGREGVFVDVDPALAPPSVRPLFMIFRKLARKGTETRADALSRAMARLGPSYVKLGQFLATRPDVVGMRSARALETLQDRMPAFPHAEAIAIVEAALGAPIAKNFSYFGEAVAAASVAQVHRARIRSGDNEYDVAVKILRPGIEKQFSRDLGDMLFAARFAERHSGEARRLRMVEVVETVARSVRLEMDFRLEAAAASEFADNVADDIEFRAPKIDWGRTARDVLTLEWIEGVPLTDIVLLKARHLDLPLLARNIIQGFLRHAMRDGFFHADMHQGNLLIDSTGRIAAVDFGIMGRLSLAQRRFLAEILFGFITKDYRRVAQVHFDAGYVPDIHDVDEFAQAIRAIGEPIHSRPADEISMASLLTLLFEITALFDMATRTELVLLQKTMVVVEGVARTLDPRLDMWKTAEPVVRLWIEENLGPIGKLRDAGGILQSSVDAFLRAPRTLEKLETLIDRLDHVAREGVHIAPAALHGLANAQKRAAFWTTALGWVIAAACLYFVFIS